MKQELTARKQDQNEPLDRYTRDLQLVFHDNFELTEEEKVWLAVVLHSGPTH